MNDKPKTWDALAGFCEGVTPSVEVSVVLPPASWRGAKYPPPFVLKKRYIEIPLSKRAKS